MRKYCAADTTVLCYVVYYCNVSHCQISDRVWYEGLPFMGIVPWPELVVSIEQSKVTVDTLNAVLDNTRDYALKLRRQLIARHADDLSCTSETSRVFSNIMFTAQRTCMLPPTSNSS
jgi:hypothetical protein